MQEAKVQRKYFDLKIKNVASKESFLLQFSYLNELFIDCIKSIFNFIMFSFSPHNIFPAKHVGFLLGSMM